MNKWKALSILQAEESDELNTIIEKAEQRVFEIKNFILRSAPVPKLFAAKKKQLHRIDQALASIAEQDTLKKHDERAFRGQIPEADISFPDFDTALECMELSLKDELTRLFEAYESKMTRAKLKFSGARSAHYASAYLAALIEVEQAFQSVFLHFFEKTADELVRRADKDVKLTSHTMSSEIKRCCVELGLDEVVIGNRPEGISGSDRDVQPLADEWYKLAKMHKRM